MKKNCRNGIKIHHLPLFVALALVVSLSRTWADPIGTMFTYQGQLRTTNGPLTGLYDFRFTLYSTDQGQGFLGQQLAPGVGVTNGLFSVPLDFGAVFQGQRTWMEIAVRPNGSTINHVVLSPLQELTPTPYAIFAENAASIGGVSPGGFWGIAGNNVNPGAKLGTTDSQPLILIVGGQTAQRLEPTGDTPNIVGGYSGNSVANGLPGATIAGGGSVIPFNGLTQPNTINNNGYYGTIGGGYNNQVGGYGGVIGGGSVNVAGGDFSVVTGGQFNTNTGPSATIAGGRQNLCSGSQGTIGGGLQNTCAGDEDTIAGGQLNSSTDGWNNTIGGGYHNAINNGVAYGTIGGGLQNTVQNSLYATVGGGALNASLATGATVGGGGTNSASGPYSTVPGGQANAASGRNSFAAGRNAKAQHQGSFVWADSQAGDFVSEFDNEVRFRCKGGVTFGSGVAGVNQWVYWVPNNGGWSFSSDRNLKERFSAIDSEAILNKVASLPVVEWSYKGSSQRHIGPMAQDFHSLFPLNDNDKMLNECDLHGVALAAIQGLSRKIQAQDTELKARESQIEQMRIRLDQLEKAVLGFQHEHNH
jgi:hypothetical protein